LLGQFYNFNHMRKLSRGILFLILLEGTFVLKSFSQNYSIVLLKKEVRRSKTEAEKATAYWKLSRDYVRVRYDSALWYGTEAVRIARKNNIPEALAWGLLYTANVYQQQGNLRLCFANIEEARNLFCKLKISNPEWAEIYTVFGASFYAANDNDSSLHYFIKAKELADIQQVNPLIGIGHVYMRTGLYDTAILFYKKAYALSKDEKSKARAFASAGQAFKEINKLDTAVYLLKKGRLLSGKIGTWILTEHINRALAEVYLNLYDMQEAKKFALEAIKISESVGSAQNQANGYNILAKIAFEDGNYGECIKQSERAREIGKKEKLEYVIANACFNLFKTSLVMGNMAEATKYENQFKSANEAESEKENGESVIHYQIRYGALKKQKENFELKNTQLKNEAVISRQQTVTVVIGGALLIAVLTAIFMYRMYILNNRNAETLKKKNGEIEKQNTLIANALKDREAAQAILVHSEKMASLGQLMAGIAHELNNPITFISAGALALKSNLSEIKEHFHSSNKDSEARIDNKSADENGKLGDEFWQENEGLIKAVLVGAERTTKIVNSLRTFSYEAPDGLQLADLIECLEATLIMLQSEIKNRIEISKDYRPIPLVECNIGEIGQVFMNIISNAVQAIIDKGNITIATGLTIDKHTVFISIRDSGIGIPEHIINRIFDPFFTTKPIGKGTGLGLSISYKLIEKHHGSIEVHSSLDKGTEFIIKIPVKKVSD